MKVSFVPTYSWVMTAEGWRPLYHGVKRCFVDDLGPLALAPWWPQVVEGGLNEPDGECQ